MKYMISYFAQVRNMNSNILPLSTAVWPPKWWTVHVDKNNVLNGFRISELIPGEDCRDLCRGPEPERRVCNGDPDTCDFLSTYKKQIDKINFNEFKDNLENIVSDISNNIKINIDTICFLVYEKYDNPCSERLAIKQWWKENTGCELIEFEKEVS